VNAMLPIVSWTPLTLENTVSTSLRCFVITTRMTLPLDPVLPIVPTVRNARKRPPRTKSKFVCLFM
jgi:hypothetical protein